MEFYEEAQEPLFLASSTTLVTKDELLALLRSVDTSLESVGVILHSLEAPGKEADALASLAILQKELKYFVRWSKKKISDMGVEVE